MKRRLIDPARRRLATTRGGGAAHIALSGFEVEIANTTTADVEEMLTRLDSALERLSVEHPRAAQTVQLRFLGGMTTEEAAGCLGLSPGTVKRDWAFARAWLAVALEESR